MKGVVCTGISLILLTLGFGTADLLINGCPSGSITSITQSVTVRDDGTLLVEDRKTAEIPLRVNSISFRLPSGSEVLDVTHSAGSEFHRRGDMVVTGKGERGLNFNRGHNEYGVKYTVADKIQYTDSRAQLIWNLTGEGVRKTAAERISLAFELPETIKADEAEVTIYKKSDGVQRVTEMRRSDNGNRLLLTARSVNPGDTLQAHISWPSSSAEKKHIMDL